MVRLYGPLMSMDASGTIADAVTFSKWKGRNYARQRVIPANPQSGLQTGVRAMMSALAKCWAGLTATQQGYWDDLASATSISPFNAFVQFNMNRFAQFKGPVVNPNDTDNTGTPPDWGTCSATAGVKSATCIVAFTHQNNAFMSGFFRGTTNPFTASKSNLVHAYCNMSDSAETWIDAPLAAGTYYYKPCYCVADGYIIEAGAILGPVVIA